MIDAGPNERWLPPFGNGRCVGWVLATGIGGPVAALLGGVAAPLADVSIPAAIAGWAVVAGFTLGALQGGLVLGERAGDKPALRWGLATALGTIALVGLASAFEAAGLWRWGGPAPLLVGLLALAFSAPQTFVLARVREGAGLWTAVGGVTGTACGIFVHHHQDLAAFLAVALGVLAQALVLRALFSARPSSPPPARRAAVIRP